MWLVWSKSCFSLINFYAGINLHMNYILAQSYRSYLPGVKATAEVWVTSPPPCAPVRWGKEGRGRRRLAAPVGMGW